MLSRPKVSLPPTQCSSSFPSMHEPRSHHAASHYPDALLHSPHTLSHLHLYDRHITSLSTIPNLSHSTRLTDLNLHSNGLTSLQPTAAFGFHCLAHSLTMLDVSSNQLTRIDGLAPLVRLTHLNLASNAIQAIEGLQSLVSLSRLNLSYNDIQSLEGLQYTEGNNNASLTALDLRANRIATTRQLHWLKGCTVLHELWLTDGEGVSADDSGGVGVNGNVVCRSANYVATVLTCAPSLRRLDGAAVTEAVSLQLIRRLSTVALSLATSCGAH